MHCRSCGELREVVPGQQCIGDNHWQLAEDYSPSNTVRGTIQCGDDCLAASPVEQLAALREVADFFGEELTADDLPTQLRAVHEQQQVTVTGFMQQLGMATMPQLTSGSTWQEEQGRYQVPLPPDLEFSVEE